MSEVLPGHARLTPWGNWNGVRVPAVCPETAAGMFYNIYFKGIKTDKQARMGGFPFRETWVFF